MTHSLSAFFQTIMEQFNPSLRTFIAMGKNYEKALAGSAGALSRWTLAQPLEPGWKPQALSSRSRSRQAA